MPIPFFFPKGDYIYLEADKFSQAGQSFRLVSPSFCAPGTICVEFTYYMYGLGEDTKLKLLLGSPAGSFLTSLWQRIGSQSPGWLNASITIPSGQQQPMQVRDRGSGPFKYVWGMVRRTQCLVSGDIIRAVMGHWKDSRAEKILGVPEKALWLRKRDKGRDEAGTR